MEHDADERGPGVEPTPEPTPTPAPEPESLPEMPSPEATEKAEQLLRQMKVHQMRGDKTVAEKLLDEAVAVAPGSAEVILAQAANLLARGQKSRARDILKMGLKLYQQHPQLENNYGELVLELADFSSTLGMSEMEIMARGNSASWLSLFLPGLGQMVMGRTQMGLTILSVWGCALAWTLLTPNGLSGIGTAFGVKGGEFNAVVLLPLFITICAHVYSVMDAGTRAKRLKPKVITRPVPPIDKDFEI